MDHHGHDRDGLPPFRGYDDDNDSNSMHHLINNIDIATDNADLSGMYVPASGQPPQWLEDPKHRFNMQSLSMEMDDSTYGSVRTLSSSSVPPQQRRKAQNLDLNQEQDRITGYVFASGQFGCAQSECADFRFGRQADYRRHHTVAHAKKARSEYFCTVEGCDRSRKPRKGGKGHSFGNREDKMQEHVKTVHLEYRKTKRPLEPGGIDKEEPEEACEEAVVADVDEGEVDTSQDPVRAVSPVSRSSSYSGQIRSSHLRSEAESDAKTVYGIALGKS